MSGHTIPVEPIVLVYAFNYALGRRSYAVDDVADALIAHVGQLLPGMRQTIADDIDEAIDAGRAGDLADAQRWRHVEQAMTAANLARARVST